MLLYIFTKHVKIVTWLAPYKNFCSSLHKHPDSEHMFCVVEIVECCYDVWLRIKVKCSKPQQPEQFCLCIDWGWGLRAFIILNDITNAIKFFLILNSNHKIDVMLVIGIGQKFIIKKQFPLTNWSSIIISY